MKLQIKNTGTGTTLISNSGRRDQSGQFCEALALIEQKSRWIVPFKVDVLPFLNTVPVCFENKGWVRKFFLDPELLKVIAGINHSGFTTFQPRHGLGNVTNNIKQHAVM